MKRARFKTGSVVFDKHITKWRFLEWVNGKRKSRVIGSKQEFPTKAAAQRAAQSLRAQTHIAVSGPTVAALVEQYKTEKLPDRKDTRRTYSSWIRLHILPKWGQHLITDLQARPVELWLESLALAPKSRTHIRGILSSLWNFAMWKQGIPMQVNPIRLVTVKGASKRTRKPRSLTVEQFRLLLSHLASP